MVASGRFPEVRSPNLAANSSWKAALHLNLVLVKLVIQSEAVCCCRRDTGGAWSPVGRFPEVRSPNLAENSSWKAASLSCSSVASFPPARPPEPELSPLVLPRCSHPWSSGACRLHSERTACMIGASSPVLAPAEASASSAADPYSILTQRSTSRAACGAQRSNGGPFDFIDQQSYTLLEQTNMVHPRSRWGRGVAGGQGGGGGLSPDRLATLLSRVSVGASDWGHAGASC